MGLAPLPQRYQARSGASPGDGLNLLSWPATESLAVSGDTLRGLTKDVKKNGKKPAENYLKKGWNTLLPLKEYTESTGDTSSYESSPIKPDAPYFPYDFTKIIEEKNETNIG